MGHGNDFFMQMCKEAEEEIASGKKGWKEVDSNTLLLACFSMLSNHLTHSITRPLWFFSGTVFAGLVGWGISALL